MLAVQRLTSAYEAVEILYPGENNVPLHRCYLIRHAQVQRLRSEELAKQRAELEGDAGMAAMLSYQPDVSILLTNQSYRSNPSWHSCLLRARSLPPAPVSTSRSRDYCSAIVGVRQCRMAHPTSSSHLVHSIVPVCATIMHIPSADPVPRHELPRCMHEIQCKETRDTQ